MFSYRRLLFPEQRYVWVQVRIYRETDKAVLVALLGLSPHWIPKSRIGDIRLRNNIFELYVREGEFG
jgi:hypothetical protein